MLSYNIDNDFKFNVLPTVGGAPVDFSKAEEIIVVITDPSNNQFNPEFELVENGIRIEILKDKTQILGEYFLKIQYRNPDPTFSDQYQDKTIGLKAFKIVPVGSETVNFDGVIEIGVISADETPSGAASTNKLEFHIENDFKITLRPSVDDVLVDLESMIDLEVICISYSKKQFIPAHIITEAGIEIEFQKESIDVTGDYLIKLKYKLQDASYQDGYRHITNAINAFIIKPLDETLSAAGTEIDVEGSKWYKGDDGEQGLQGIQGVKGDTGDQGLQGIQGVKGDTGDPGLQGIQGVKGDKGDTGDQGLQGIQGVKGDKGDTGDQGLQGIKGDKGDTGDQGLQGIQGVKGDKGDTGDQGLQGIKGDKGDTGDQGLQGIQGIKGDKGDTGDQGFQGIQGVKGDTGDQGLQGIQGVKGDKGDTGDQGFQGIQGVKGDTGDQGLQGIQGVKGDKGDSGDPGADGSITDKYFDVSAIGWVSDTPTYTGFSYKCEISITGVTSSDVAMIIFSQEQASSGNYAQVCEIGSGIVTIYSKVNANITIPTILIFKAN